MKLKRARKQIFCFLLSAYLIASNLVIARAEALPEVMEGATTIADCVMSYYYMSGTSIANTTWINNLYSQFGATLGTVQSFAEQGLMVINSSGVWEPATQLYETIANVPGYTALGLDQVFQVTADEATAIGAAAGVTGAATLGQAIASVATTGVLPAALAVAGGVALGVGINYVREHLLNYFGKQTSNGVKIDAATTITNNLFPGGSYGEVVDGIRSYYITCASGAYVYGYYSGNYFLFGMANPTSLGKSFKDWEFYNNKPNGSVANGTLKTQYNSNVFTFFHHPTAVNVPNLYNSQAEFEAAFNNWKNGVDLPEPVKAPDVIGPNGNIQSVYDPSTGKYTCPNSTPQVDPNTQAGKPLTQEDWLRYANTVSSNNNNPNIDPDTENADAFQELSDLIIVPKPSIDPDNPADPDSPTNPDPETYPDPNPVPNPQPVPDPEVWPEYPEQPEYTEKQTENETDIHEGDPWTTPDLLNKFPFCIPNDIKNIFSKLNSGNRQAPHIAWRFNPPGTPVDYTFDVDFSTWDSVAVLLRNLELMAFVIALGVATKNLILA